MTKKKKVFPEKKYHYQYQALTFQVGETVHQPTKSMPSNLAEAKEKFLKSGKTPQFQIQDKSKLAELAGRTKNKIRFNLLGEAEYILEKVKEEYGEAEYFLEHMFGVRIEKEEATPMVLAYIDENSLSESIKINWCDNMPCSAKMVWTGPTVNANRPELRKYSLWINSSDENNYMREIGIKCLMDHELGTHFFRMVNDGFQPWFSNRSRFGLRNLGGIEGQCTEEGLASINTALRGRVKLLWSAALAYYTACKAAEMTFKQLFDHIGRYISNPDSRWKAVMRVKRGLTDPNDLGGFGNDQCYFEGAVNILRNIDNIDFNLLMSGKVCYDELDRIKRMVRRDAIKLPVFMKNMGSYIKSLRKMAAINNLGEIYPHRSPPSAYLRRLDERRSEGTGQKVKKVRLFNKLKGSYKKHKDDDVNDEVKSFQSTEKFINRHKIIKEAKKKIKDEDNRLIELINNLKDQIKTVDSQLNNKLSQCNDLLSDHSWSSKEYKDSLLSETFSKESFKYQDESNSTETVQDHAKSEESSFVEEHPDLADIAEKSWKTLKNINENKSKYDTQNYRHLENEVLNDLSIWDDSTCRGQSLEDSCFSNQIKTHPNHEDSLCDRNLFQYKQRFDCKSANSCQDSCVSEVIGGKLTPDSYSKVCKCGSEVSKSKPISLQKKKPLIHPTVEPLAKHINNQTQVNQVQNKNKSINDNYKRDEAKPSMFSHSTNSSKDIIKYNVYTPKLNKHNVTSNEQVCQSSHTDSNSFQSERESLFPTKMTANNFISSLSQKSNRLKSLNQGQHLDRCRPIPLYSDVTLAAVKLGAKRGESAFVTLTDFKQNRNNETASKLFQQKDSMSSIIMTKSVIGKPRNIYMGHHHEAMTK